MGGKFSLLLATEEPALAAAVAYYGAPPSDEAAIARIKAPVLGNFGAKDSWARTVAFFARHLKKS